LDLFNHLSSAFAILDGALMQIPADKPRIQSFETPVGSQGCAKTHGPIAVDT
jgi:hypothetical protein